eukprot:scaffold733_cov267-Pinguiococcus_pyrenoidosus.AAC.29
MDSVAVARNPVPMVSAETFFAVSAPNRVDPRRQQAMKQENTFPKGTAPSTTLPRLGAHWSTKMYMAPSKSACTAPTSAIFLSLAMTLIASLMLGPSGSAFPSASPSAFPSASPSAFPSDGAPVSLLVPFGATFSFHCASATTPARARKPTLSSNGPDGPRWSAAAPARAPAEMATRLSPPHAHPKVCPRYLSCPVRCASPTSHASGAEKSRLVPKPLKSRPSTNTLMSSDLVESAAMV